MAHPSVTCYATPYKAKASALCGWFAQGVEAAGGTARVYPGVPQQLEPGAAMFYGVTRETAHLWRQAIKEGREWYYIDNSYFDVSRGTFYRITRNRLQHSGRGASNGTRFEALNIPVRPWRDG